MEQHGNNHRQSVFAVIPARFASTRLEGKLLLPVAGRPLILHTVERAESAAGVDRVIVATDDEQIRRVVEASGREAVLTDPRHQSGSDRIAEVAARLPENSIVVNVQGDEPLISPRTIERAVAAIVADETADISTVSEKIEDRRDVLSSDAVKLVTDENGFALYFSRSPIPFPRDAARKYGSLENALESEPQLVSLFRKHAGLYVYRREYLLEFTHLRPSRLEQTEMLEQLRALENGARIKVVEAAAPSIGVDTREDYERVKKLLENAATAGIREARADDLAQIARVHVESWRQSFAGLAPEDYLKNLSPAKREAAFRANLEKKDYRMLIAANADNEIVGFADFGPPSDDRFDFERELYAIYLLRDFQRKGIGAALLKAVAARLRESGHRSLYLQALEDSPYRQFYEKMGGRLIGRGRYRLGSEDYATVFYGWPDLSEL